MIRAQRYKTRSLTNSVNNGGDYIDYGGANQEQIISGTTDEIMNQYTYDEKYQLSKVVFGKYTSNNTTFTANGNNCYKEFGAAASSGIDYDANGNITSLKRNGNNVRDGILMDDFAYSYTGNTNQLASITDGASSSVYSNDIDAATSKAFTYNTIGQMIKSAAEGIANNNIEYNVRGLMKKVTFDNGNTAEYWYDDRGQKIKTEYYNGTVSKYTWYISDAGGNPLAIYEYDGAAGTPAFTLVEQPVYGSGRIGILDKVTGIINYEITDHLGNVRATIKGISTGVYELTSRADYYPHGGIMPGRNYVGTNNHRQGYQGQFAEKDPETNLNSFELRMYDGRLGRFISPDPFHQYHSPYLGMGNNPVNNIDPNGGVSDGWLPYGDKSGFYYVNSNEGTTFAFWENSYGQMMYGDENGHASVSGAALSSVEISSEMPRDINYLFARMQGNTYTGSSKSAPFHSVEMGFGYNGKKGPVKYNYKHTWTDNGALKLVNKETDELSASTDMGVLQYNATIFLKFNTYRPSLKPLKIIITTPLPDNFYIKSTFNEDGAWESNEIGLSAKPQKAGIEAKYILYSK